MFGTTIKKYCSKCDEIQEEHTTVTYMVGNRDYVKHFDCPKCGEDLAVEDRAVLKKAVEDGVGIAVVMS